MPFEEPEVLATFDRTWGDNKEELRLERGTYKDKPTYALRLCWQGGDGTWRWAQQKPGPSGKCFAQLHLKAGELRDLGAALMLAAESAPAEEPRRAPSPREQHREAYRPPTPVNDDDIPF
jgi:hypothetical protein